MVQIRERKAENSQCNQLKIHLGKSKLDVTRCKRNTIKRWILNLKKIEKKVEIMPQNDGRRCMMSNVC